MRVRIQLIRDNGNVVLDLMGQAGSPFVWNMPVPMGWLVFEDGTKMDGFTYTPSLCEFEEMTEQERETLYTAMAKVVEK